MVVALWMIYFTSTFNTTYKFVYFSGDAALRSWISPKDETVFEHETDNFLIKFNNDFFYAAKKDSLMWVKDNFELYNNKTTIGSTFVKDTVYIYGNVCLDGIENLTLSNFFLRPIEFKMDSIKTGDNQLIFCMELPSTKLTLEWISINFIDKSGNVISYPNHEQNMRQNQLIKEVLLTLDSCENKLNFNDYTPKFFEKILSEEYYITPDGEIEAVKESVRFYFYDEYVMLKKCKTVDPFRDDFTQFYSTYNLEYTDALIELKSILSKDL
jgi:hypothetical protein